MLLKHIISHYVELCFGFTVLFCLSVCTIFIEVLYLHLCGPTAALEDINKDKLCTEINIHNIHLISSSEMSTDDRCVQADADGMSNTVLTIPQGPWSLLSPGPCRSPSGAPRRRAWTDKTKTREPTGGKSKMAWNLKGGGGAKGIII